MFLIRDSNPNATAHHWDGHDTACKMWSTGGMNKNKKWSIRAASGSHPICTMCANVQAKKGIGNAMDEMRKPMQTSAVRVAQVELGAA